MNLRALIDSFRGDADDLLKPYLWGDTLVTGYFNEAEEEACIRARLLFEKTDASMCRIGVIAGTSTYAVHESVIDIVYATLTDGAGTIYELGFTDRIEMDRARPGWRAETTRPTALIHYDNHLELNCIVDADYTMALEVNRLPLQLMASMTDTPEINRKHHLKLVQWALHRAYSKPDAETLNLDKAARAEQEFTRIFGPRPSADLRKKQQANRLHRNKAVW